MSDSAMTEQEKIEVAINGEIIPPPSIRRTFIAEDPAPHHLIAVPISSPPIHHGENDLTVGLASTAKPTGIIQIEEVAIRIDGSS